MSERAKQCVWAALGIAVLLGLYGVEDAFDWLIAIGVAVAAAVVAGLALLLQSCRSRKRRIALRVLATFLAALAALLIAFLALVGFDVVLNFLLDLLRHIHPLRHLLLPVFIGLILAAVVFGSAIYWCLWQTGWAKGHAAATAVGTTVIVIFAAPFVIGELKDVKTDPVVTSKPVPSKLDVRIVSDGQPHPKLPEPPPTPVLGEFDVSYSVGFAAGDGVHWTLVDGKHPGEALEAIAEGDKRPAAGTPPAPPEDADPVLLLLVDGTAPIVEHPAGLPDVSFKAGEVWRWKRVAAGAGAPGSPVFALLQTTSKARLERWSKFAAPYSAVSAQALESQTATDAAVRLAVAAPTSQSDFSLAMKYRPILLFDGDEPVPWPLSVQTLFKEGRVRLCHDEGTAKTKCDSTSDPRELESGGTHLGLTLRDSEELKPLAKRELKAARKQSAQSARLTGGTKVTSTAVPAAAPPPGATESPSEGAAPPGVGSAIYVHPFSVVRDHEELLYLDYWWYLPDNPVSLGGGALCGAGLVIAGVTCQNHQSDWEGMTVVVNRTGDEPRVNAVQYAQHSSVVRYAWSLLQERWKREPWVKKLDATISDAAVRPLAFIAKGTHATYPTPCDEDCKQVPNSDVSEESHRGNLAWVGDDTGACGKASCLLTLPTRASGKEPALWNDYDGTWGEHHCFLNYYCDSGTPPTAPGHQGRYRNPVHYDGIVGENWRFRPVPSEG